MQLCVLAIINKSSNLSQYSDVYFSKEVRDLWHMANIKKLLKRLPPIGFVMNHHMALGNSLMPKASLQEHFTGKLWRRILLCSCVTRTCYRKGTW